MCVGERKVVGRKYVCGYEFVRLRGKGLARICVFVCFFVELRVNV